MRHLTHLNLVKFSHNIFISNVQKFTQVLKGMLSLESTIVNQRVPHNLMCFFYWLMGSIKNQIIALLPSNPREAIPQEKPYVTERFQ